MDRVPPSLPDELIAEILARVPYKSLCRFKCVSRPWLALCSEPSVRRRCPQTLSGFFFSTLSSSDSGVSFVNVSGRGPPMVDPSLSFLPAGHRGAILFDCCNGLLLFGRINANSPVYFVCNPATEEWMDLPDTEPMSASNLVVRLGFEPAVSSHFSVFLLVHTETNDRWRNRVTGVDFYSSETGRWTYRLSEWGDDTTVFGGMSRSSFFDSTLYLTSFDKSVVTVNTSGNIWRKIHTPSLWKFDFIGHSQGQLYAVDKNYGHGLTIFVKCSAGPKWRLPQIAPAPVMHHIDVHAIHPKNKLIYLTVGHERKLVSYDIDTREVDAIRTLGCESLARLHPYIPFFSEWLPDRHLG